MVPVHLHFLTTKKMKTLPLTYFTHSSKKSLWNSPSKTFKPCRQAALGWEKGHLRGFCASVNSAWVRAEASFRVVQGTHPFWLCLAFQLLDCSMETEETMQPKTATESYTAFSVFCCLLATNLHHNIFEFVLYCMYDNLINILFSCVL